MKPLLWLCSLLPLLLTVHTVFVEPLDPVGQNTYPCTIEAWVRAPDLDPGKIIPGQVRIQTKGSCNPIMEYSLILRFKERVWVKILKPDMTSSEEPPRQLLNTSINDMNMSGSRFSNVHESCISDRALWTAAEEERIAFESRYKIFHRNLGNPQFLNSTREDHLIRDFALLVPTTNYPPSERILGRNILNEPTSERGNEHIYMYTVEAKFLNGTTIEVPAGYSAFNTLTPYPPAQDKVPEVVTFRANFTKRRDPPSNALNFSLNVNVTFPRGRNLEQGTIHNLTFTLWDNPQPIDDRFKDSNITLTLFHLWLRTSSQGRRMQRLSLEKDVSIPSAEFMHCQLTHTGPESIWRSRWVDGTVDPSQKTTTSGSLNISPLAFPSFDMYYQSFEPQLSIRLMLTIADASRSQDGALDEEYYWAPTFQHPKERKFFMHFRTDIPITIYPRAKQVFHVTHYLSPDARHPVFVDPSTTIDLWELSVGERDLLAPRSIPTFKYSTNDILRERYYPPSLYYVGDAWQRKVLNGGPNIVQEDRIKTTPLRVQMAS